MWSINKSETEGTFMGAFYGHEKAITIGGFTPDGYILNWLFC